MSLLEKLARRCNCSDQQREDKVYNQRIFFISIRTPYQILRTSLGQLLFFYRLNEVFFQTKLGKVSVTVSKCKEILIHCFSNEKISWKRHHFEKPHADQLGRSALREGGGGEEGRRGVTQSLKLEVVYVERKSVLAFYRLIFLIFV